MAINNDNIYVLSVRLHYNLNGGSGNIADSTNTTSGATTSITCSVQLRSNEPTPPTGYEFVGWRYNNSTYQGGSIITGIKGPSNKDDWQAELLDDDDTGTTRYSYTVNITATAVYESSINSDQWISTFAILFYDSIDDLNSGNYTRKATHRIDTSQPTDTFTLTITNGVTKDENGSIINFPSGTWYWYNGTEITSTQLGNEVISSPSFGPNDNWILDETQNNYTIYHRSRTTRYVKQSSCGYCETCQTCNTCQTECQLSHQTPITSSIDSVKDMAKALSNVNVNIIIDYDTHWKPILDLIKKIKDEYSSFKGTKSFSNWTAPAGIAENSTIKVQNINSILSNTATQNEKITASIYNNLVHNIQNYPFDTTLCKTYNSIT